MIKKYFTDEELKDIKGTTDEISRATKIVYKVFQDKFDKGGTAYFNHLTTVATNVEKSGRVVALLHDVVEDSDITLDDIEEFFGPKVREDVHSLTREEGEDYLGEYIPRLLKGSYTALTVKYYDLLNNLDLSRIGSFTKKDIKRVKNRYLKALEMVVEELDKRVK